MNSEYLNRSLESSFLETRTTQIINGNSLKHPAVLAARNSPYYISNNSMVQQPVQYMPSRLETSASQSHQILAQNQRTTPYHSNNIRSEISQHSYRRPSVLSTNPTSHAICWDRVSNNNNMPIVCQENPVMNNLRYYKKPIVAPVNLNVLSAKNSNNNIPPLSVNNVNFNNNNSLVHQENSVMKNLRCYRKSTTVPLNLKGLNLENVNNNVQPPSTNNTSEYRIQYDYNRNTNSFPKIHVKDVISLNNSVATNYQSQFSVYKPVYHQKNIQMTDRKFENISPVNSLNINQCKQCPLSISSVLVSNNTSKPQKEPLYVSAANSINQFYYSNSTENCDNCESNCSKDLGQKYEANQNGVHSQSSILPTIKCNVKVSSNREEILPSNSHIAYCDNSVYYSNCDNFKDNIGKTTSGSTLSNLSEYLKNGNNCEESTFSKNSLLKTILNAVKTSQPDERGAKYLENLNLSQPATNNDFLTNKNLLEFETMQSTSNSKIVNTNLKKMTEILAEKNKIINSAENFPNQGNMQKNSNNDSEVKFIEEISIEKGHGNPRQIKNKENEKLNWDSSSFKNKINRKKLDLLIEFVKCDSFDENFAKSNLGGTTTEVEREKCKENFSINCYPDNATFESLENQDKENETFENINEKLNLKNGINSGTSVHVTRDSIIINSKYNESDTTVGVISAKEIILENDDETEVLNQGQFSKENIEENENLVKSKTEELKPLISQEIKEEILKSVPEKCASTLSENKILGCAFEDPDFINTMKTFQKIKFHKCISCNLSLPNSSFWINIISGELRCLNCFKKMSENCPTEKDNLEKRKEETEVHCISRSSRKRKEKGKRTLDMKKVKVSEKTLSSDGAMKTDHKKNHMWKPFYPQKKVKLEEETKEEENKHWKREKNEKFFRW